MGIGILLYISLLVCILFLRNPSLNWNLESEPSPLAANRQIELPRGKVVGGSSAINACVFMRGHPKEYDNWAHQHNTMPEWDYTQCLHYFKRCANHLTGELASMRGGSGRLSCHEGLHGESTFMTLLLDAGRQSSTRCIRGPKRFHA